MSGRSFKAEKDPQEVKEFKIDWTNRLGSATIITSSWNAVGDITISSTANTTVDATVWVSRGRAGDVVRLVNTVTTSGGETLERTIEILIRDL